MMRFKQIGLLMIASGALATFCNAQSDDDLLLKYEWQGFIRTPDGIKQLRFQAGGHPAAQVITDSVPTGKYATECNLSPVSDAELKRALSNGFGCSGSTGVGTERFRLHVDNGQGSLTASGEWGDRPFILCPVYSDQKATDDCLKDIATQLDRSHPRASRNAHTQAKRIHRALPKIESALTKLSQKGIQVPSGTKSRIEFMQEFYTVPGKAPARYADTLDGMATLLSNAEKTPNNAETEALVMDISDNLEIMYEASKPTLVSPSAQDYQITVATMQGNKEVSGWEIFYMEYFYRHVRNEIGPDSFPHPSSPTTYHLPPSRYIIQAVDQSTGKRSEPKVVIVNDKAVDCVIEVK